MDPLFITMKDIKREGECGFCFRKEDLFSLLEPYNFEDNVEIYSAMIAECFQIEFTSYVEEYNRFLYLICKNCVFRLRDALLLRSQIQIAYDRFQAECRTMPITMKDIKREGECCFCSNKDDLFSMLEPYNFEDSVEIYSTMVGECFQIDVSSYIEEYNRNLYLMCKNCVIRLRDSIMLRTQIHIVYNRLQAECCMRGDPTAISSEYSDVIETKEHILKYDISEYDNTECKINIDSGTSLSNENALKLKPLKIVLEKIDNDTIENVSIVSANDGSKIYLCNICNRLFRNVFAIQKHTRSHLNIKDFVCDYCKKQFKHKFSLKNHILSHIGIEKFKCDVCDKYFVSKMSFGRHRYKYHSVKWSCNICGRTLCSKYGYNNHVLSHSDVKNEKCEVCNKSFATKSSLNTHKKLHFKSKEKTCKYCNKAFHTNQHLIDHQKMHLDIKDFICEFCQKGFRRKYTLKRHILLHKSVENVKCDLCNKLFLYKSDLALHKRTHKNVNTKLLDDKKCQYCNRAFKTRQNLLYHEKIHLDVKDLTCDYCKRGFTQKSNLREHIMIHMGIKNIKCDLCDKRFVSKTRLSKHKGISHPVSMLCSVCGQNFNSKRKLNNHMKVHG